MRRCYRLVARLAAVVALTVFMLAEAEAAQAIQATQPNASSAARLLDVPFVSQTEALCGGAAAAMVARYWGDRAVYAEDFAELVDAEARGIRTDVLTEVFVDRGWDAHAFRGTERGVRRHLEQGRPVIVLVRESPDRYHYLVIVGWLDTQVIVHDPGPRALSGDRRDHVSSVVGGSGRLDAPCLAARRTVGSAARRGVRSSRNQRVPCDRK